MYLIMGCLVAVFVAASMFYKNSKDPIYDFNFNLGVMTVTSIFLWPVFTVIGLGYVIFWLLIKLKSEFSNTEL